MQEPQSVTPPAQNESSEEKTRDHLKLLGLFYILLGLMALPALAVVSLHGPILDYVLENTPDPELAESIQSLFNTFIAGIILLIVVHVVASIYIGICYRKQKHHTLCLIAAVLCCFSFPLGTILGVFSIVVLLKPEAKDLFGQRAG